MARRGGGGLIPPVQFQSGGGPLSRQLYLAIRTAIVEGRLKAGDRLPSVRQIALDLGISRTTAVAALEQLQGEGFVGTQERSGSFVLPGISPDAGKRQRTSSRRPAAAATPAATISPRPFRSGVPDVAAFPWPVWTRLATRNAKRLCGAHAHYGDLRGIAETRHAIAAYLGAARGLRCSSDQIFVVPGAQAAFHLVSRALCRAGDKVWVEDPGYRGSKAAIEAAGGVLVAVPVDAEGIRVDRGRQLAEHAAMAVVTPAHQFPIGAILPATRRRELLRWASERDAWIVEDDYDAEFRFEGPPIAALQGMDANAQRVVHIGTFSKTMFPALRLGYVVAPLSIVPDILRVRSQVDRAPPALEQLMLCEFLHDGHYARHLTRMRRVYGARRTALLKALESCGASSTLEVAGSATGLSISLLLPKGRSATGIATHARELGLELSTVAENMIGPVVRDGLILGYAGYSEAELVAAVPLLAQAIKRHFPARK